jgi:hypothetical protein
VSKVSDDDGMSRAQWMWNLCWLVANVYISVQLHWWANWLLFPFCLATRRSADADTISSDTKEERDVK